MKQLKLLLMTCVLLWSYSTTSRAQTDVTNLVSTSKDSWSGRNTYARALSIYGGNSATFVEKFYENDSGVNTFTCDAIPLKQSLSVDNGFYLVTLYAHSNMAWKESSLVDGQSDYAYIYAKSGKNTSKQYIIANRATQVTTTPRKYTVMIEVTDGSLELGLGLDNVTLSNWHLIQIYRMTRFDNKLDALRFEMKEALDEANSYYTNSIDNDEATAKAAYKVAIDKAQETYDTNNTIELAETNKTAIADAVSNLKAAYQTFALSGASPSDGYSFDMAFKVNNSTFDAFNADGWAVPTKTEGNYGFNGAVEYYHYVPAFDLNQSITGLPNGKYTISVQGNINNTGTSQLYAVGNNTVSSIINTGIDGSFLDVALAYAANRSLGKVSVDVIVGDGSLKIGLKDDNSSNNWCVFDNFELKYLGNIYIGYRKSVTEAKALYAEIMSASTLAELKSAVKEESELTTSEEVIDATSTLVEKIAAAKSSITAYASVKAALDKAAATKTACAGNDPLYLTTFDEKIAAIQTEYDNRTIADVDCPTKVTAINNEINLLGRSQKSVDITQYLPGADCTSDANWTISNTGTFHLNTWSPEGASDGSGMTTPFMEYWRNAGEAAGLEDATISYAITGLRPNNVYKVSVLVRQYDETTTLGVISGATLYVGSAEVDAATGVETSYTKDDITKPLRYGTYTLEGKADASGNLTFGFKVKSASFNWMSWKNVTVTHVGEVASEAQKTAYETAKATATTNKESLGFEKNEYAPYANIVPLTALTTTVDFNNTSAATVVDLTTALTTWTPNADEMNAVCNGNFENQPGGAANFYTTGWVRTNGWGQFVADADAGSTTNGKGYYNQPGSIVYGKSLLTGYTMPLKGNTWYLLTFRYASWESSSNKSMKASVLNAASEGLAETEFGANAAVYKNSGAFKIVKKLFRTGAAGDYVLTLANDGNTVIADVAIKKAVAEAVTLDETSTYTPEEKYASITLNRTFVKGWNGLVLPFDLSTSYATGLFGADKVMDFSKIDVSGTSVTLNFTENGDEIKAGKPVMIHFNETPSSTSFNVGTAILSGSAPVDVEKTSGDIAYTFKGTYGNTNLAGKVFTLIQGDYFFNYDGTEGAVKAKTFRGYFENTTKSSGAKVMVAGFNFDGETTGIRELTTDNNKTDVMFDLMGRRVNQPTKGLFILNGKKVIKK